MEAKNYTEVYIAGKVYTLGGFEEEEYLQKVAAYVNSKVSELRGQQGFLKLSADYQNVLLELNLADDVFKIRRQAAAAEKKLSAQEKETYHVKHDLVAAQMKLDAMTEQLAAVQQEMEKTAEELAAVKSELDSTKEELADSRKTLQSSEQELEEAKLELEIAGEELAAKKEELESTKKRLAQLEDHRNRRY